MQEADQIATPHPQLIIFVHEEDPIELSQALHRAQCAFDHTHLSYRIIAATDTLGHAERSDRGDILSSPADMLNKCLHDAHELHAPYFTLLTPSTEIDHTYATAVEAAIRSEQPYVAYLPTSRAGGQSFPQYYDYPRGLALSTRPLLVSPFEQLHDLQTTHQLFVPYTNLSGCLLSTPYFITLGGFPSGTLQPLLCECTFRKLYLARTPISRLKATITIHRPSDYECFAARPLSSRLIAHLVQYMKYEREMVYKYLFVHILKLEGPDLYEGGKLIIDDKLIYLVWEATPFKAALMPPSSPIPYLRRTLRHALLRRYILRQRSLDPLIALLRREIRDHTQ